MRITWITRSFLDYRVPVFGELNALTDGGLTLLYYGEVVPARTRERVNSVLGSNAVTLKGEKRFLGEKILGGGFANSTLRVPFQPGLVAAAERSLPDVLISDGFFQWTYAPLWLRATKSIPHVMCYERTAHTERHAQWYRTAYRRFVMRWIDAVCCSGRLCGQYVRSLGCPSERIIYGHMVADVDGLSKAASEISEAQVLALKSKLNLRGLVFVYVGRLIPLKGVAELLRAWADFSAAVGSREATLLLVGDGPTRDVLKDYSVSHALHNVRFSGAVDYDELAPFYKVADVFVIPTLEDNWSLVVPEAMACGLPILSSKYNGCWPEYVTPTNGWVFDPGNVKETAACLNTCLVRRDELRQMGERSIEIARRHTAKQAATAVLNGCRIVVRNARSIQGDAT